MFSCKCSIYTIPLSTVSTPFGEPAYRKAHEAGLSSGRICFNLANERAFSRYSNEIENIKSRLDTVLSAQVRYSQDYHIEEGWENVIHTYMSKRKLTKEMAYAFVDSIIIYGKYDYEIKLVYNDQFADLQKLKKEKEAQSR